MADAATTRKQRVGAVFGRAAPTYNQVGPDFFGHFGARLVHQAQVPRDGAVLDIAAGRGAVLFAAATQVGPMGQVLGVDLAEPMVVATQAAIQQRGLRHAEMRQMDAEQLQLPDGTFDAVLCGFGLMFFPELGRALCGMYRVLRPGGTVGVTTWGDRDGRWAWYQDLVKRYATHTTESMEHPDAQRLENPAAVVAVLEQAGFVDVQVTTEALEGVYADEETWWASVWSRSQRAPLEVMTPAGLAGFKADAFAAMQSQRQPDGFAEVRQARIAVGRKPLRDA